MEKYAVIVAGGSGLRMGAAVPKQFLEINNKPLIWYSLNTFLESFDDLEIILVLPEDYQDAGKAIVADTLMPGRIHITTGGKMRFHSVKKGLQLINKHSIVFVHDGVRCLLTTHLIDRCYKGAIHRGNAIPAIVPCDSLRLETFDGNSTLDRNKVRIIQTPQTFYSDIIKTAFEQDYHESFTDEASVVEQLGIKIHLVEGEETNIKITRPLDLMIAEKIMEERAMGM